MKGTPEERFWAKVDVTAADLCWHWTAGLQSAGYGRFSADGRDIGAHRFAYELLVGPIPEGLHIDHLCRVRHCVNPEHLEPVTQRENILRGECPAALNARMTECPRGHPFDEANTYLTGGQRTCRTCKLASVARSHARKVQRLTSATQDARQSA